uniref:Uncharacterized protein n=1 Tax=Anguilla anguilla TaxID=7936 RepID=A0A0E9R5S9_ANGAN
MCNVCINMNLELRIIFTVRNNTYACLFKIKY